MSLDNHVASRLKPFGVVSDISRAGFTLSLDGVETRLRQEDDYQEAFVEYAKSTGIKFDVTDGVLSAGNVIEIPLVTLDSALFRDDIAQFTDESGNVVDIGRASKLYMFTHFDSSEYEAYFETVVRSRLKQGLKYPRSINVVFRSPVTATYRTGGRSVRNLKEIGIERVRACLAKLAIERRICYEVYRPNVLPSPKVLRDVTESDWLIPKIAYESNLVSYYKVARSSPFASQSFLGYYHVLEYYFLRVAEDALHHQLRAHLNSTTFSASSDGLDRVISLIRRHGSTDDETDMLRKVLSRFVSESDFIDHVKLLEERSSAAIYTRKRSIFGEAMEITLRDGHALANAAKILKHIRNAIVHSSDRYRRDECHIPLSESENIIGEFIPIVKYFAEQIIYGTATPFHRAS